MKKINYLFTLLLALVICGNVWGEDYWQYTNTGETTTKTEKLKTAVEGAKDGTTVLLLSDNVPLADNFSTTTVKNSITVDLDGKTFQSKGSTRYFQFDKDGLTFSIKNGTFKLPEFSASGQGIIWANKIAHVILEDVTIEGKPEGTSQAIYNQASGTKFTIKGNVNIVGKYISTASDTVEYDLPNAVINEGLISQNTTTIKNIQGMTVTKDLPANVKFVNKGTLSIDGGTYNTTELFKGSYTIYEGYFLMSAFVKDTLDKHVVSGKGIHDNGTYYYVGEPVAEPEALVNEVPFANFADALAEVNNTAGCTLKLMKDINYSGNELDLTKDVTIDFNGKTLTLDASRHFYCHTANVTLTSTGAQGTLKSGTKPSNSIYLYNPNSVLTLDKVSVSGGYSTDIKVESKATNSTIILKAGTVLSKTIACGSIATTINNELEFSSIPYTGTNVTLINSGTIPVTLSGLQANVTNSGTLNIIDGTSDKNFNFTNTGIINISNGTFKGSSMSISGGTTNITGGLFSAAVYEAASLSTKLAAEYSGSQVTIKTDGYYRVVPTAQVGSVQYGVNTYSTLNDALDNVPDSTAATIKLLANTTLAQSTSISRKRSITLDMNGNDMSSGFGVTVYSNNSLDIIGTGTITTTVDFITLKSAERPDTTTLTKLHIGSGVTLNSGAASAVKAMPVSTSTRGKEYSYGIRANIEGKIQSQLYIHGAIQENVDYDCPEFILGATSETNGIYAAGYGRWTINGGAHNGKVEVRAGEMTINDGTFVNLDTDPVVFVKNDDGPTIESGSCNIAMAQHNTKQPVIITIKGGTFSAVSPIAQANPQQNEDQTANLVKCYIKGGLFKSTSATADDILVSQEQNRIFATDGFYNEKPLAKCLSTGYEAIAITEEDYPTQYAAGYRWRVGLPGQQGTTETKGNGNWNSKDIWKDGVIPTMSTKATLINNITINTLAKAYGVDFNGGKLTIKDGGLLIVGKGGVVNLDNANIVIEGNGQLAIAPDNLFQPNATVEYVAKYAGKKKDVTTVETVDDVYWEQMAIPTAAAPASFTEPADCGDAYYYNTWDITEAWVKVLKADVKNPFTGYFMTNFSDYNADPKNKVYTFTGKLAGNKVNTLNFIREGYTFFGNSCTAPMSIPELLQDLQTEDLQATVYTYRPLQGSYYTINMATVGRGGRPTEIEKMQGFFVYAKKKTSASPAYEDVVWNPLLAKQMMAPARKAANMIQNEIATAATLTITSANGWSDDVVLFEGANFTDEFDQNYDAQKMTGDHVNMFVPAAQKMAVYAVADLDKTPITVATNDEVAYTFTFSDIEGKDLELVDAVTKTVTPIVEGGSYAFVAQANATVAGRFSVRKAPNITTNIQAVRGEQAKRGIYTVMGQYMGDANLWNTLPNGVYVVNGQKVVK